MSANVYVSPTNQVWGTDKARIATEEACSYQVNMITGTPATGNLFSAPSGIPANWQTDVWVGVGNQLTVIGNCTATEIGTTSSGAVSVRATTAAQLGADANYGI
jgi:hypothetical protein